MKDNLDIKTLSDLTIFTKYARFNEKRGRRETWDELVTRNKQMHIKKFPELKKEIDAAYKFVYEKKILPSMRSMQFSGKPIEISPNRIYNCGFLPIDDWRAFSEIMFLLLGGTGIGYSVQRHHVEQLPLINKPNPSRKRRFLIGDSIEGWSDAIKLLMKSYFFGGSTIVFDFDDIRPKGAQLVTSGGKAPGPQPLKECVIKIRGILDHKITGDQLTTLEVHDIICYIADAVLAGGIRRAALIALFSADDNSMLTCKFGDWWERNPQRGRANNSAVLLRHKIEKDFFIDLFQKIKASGSGEPGFLFSNDKDYGTNPCGEISLRPFQFCNLTEVNVSNVLTQEELNNRCKAAAFIGTLQASYTEFHYLRSIWQRNTEKDALIGVGMTGIASESVMEFDMKEASKIVKEENARVAEKIGINKAARTTTVKPAGCLDPKTKIRTNIGDITIEEIFDINGYKMADVQKLEKDFLPVSEKIYIYNENNEKELITKLYVNGESETFNIQLEDGTEINCTENHKFLTTNRGWVKAKDLTENDDLLKY